MARVNVWNAMNDDDDDGECSRDALVARYSVEIVPKRRRSCVLMRRSRVRASSRALGAERALGRDDARPHRPARVRDSTREERGRGVNERHCGVARHGAFVWTASVDGERRSIDVYHAITGAHIASTDVPAPIVSQPTAASKVWSQSPVFEVLSECDGRQRRVSHVPVRSRPRIGVLYTFRARSRK